LDISSIGHIIRHRLGAKDTKFSVELESKKNDLKNQVPLKLKPNLGGVIEYNNPSSTHSL
jgi:hypothetical protein